MHAEVLTGQLVYVDTEESLIQIMNKDDSSPTPTGGGGEVTKMAIQAPMKPSPATIIKIPAVVGFQVLFVLATILIS